MKDDRLISLNAAIDAVHKNYDTILNFTSDGKTISYSIEDILSELPSAQKHGMWIVRYFGAEAKCSECGMYCVGAYDHDRCDQYCRCCGAKMDGLKLEGGQDEG